MKLRPSSCGWREVPQQAAALPGWREATDESYGGKIETIRNAFFCSLFWYCPVSGRDRGYWGKKIENADCKIQKFSIFHIVAVSFWGEMELILEKIKNKDIKPHVFLHSALLPCCFRERQRLCHENEKYGRPKKNTFFCIPSCCHPVLG